MSEYTSESVPDDSTLQDALIVDIDGFEGPLDLLLTLSRTQKVDLRRISVLQLAQQYLSFIEKARAIRLELAADYLVMAAWLAYLKSKLLLPPDPAQQGPSGEELAAHLAFQLERLEAMRTAAAQLMARDRLGVQRFARGMPESYSKTREIRYKATLLDLMQGYAHIRTKDNFTPYAFDRTDFLAIDDALNLLKPFLSETLDWTDLRHFLPADWQENPNKCRSATASTFAASLELTKSGHIELHQSESFAPLHIRTRSTDE